MDSEVFEHDEKVFWEINSNSAYEFFDDIIWDKNDDKINKLLELIKSNSIEISVGSDTHDLTDYEFGRLCEANKIASSLAEFII